MTIPGSAYRGRDVLPNEIHQACNSQVDRTDLVTVENLPQVEEEVCSILAHRVAREFNVISADLRPEYWWIYRGKMRLVDFLLLAPPVSTSLLVQLYKGEEILLDHSILKGRSYPPTLILRLCLGSPSLRHSSCLGRHAIFGQ